MIPRPSPRSVLLAASLALLPACGGSEADDGAAGAAAPATEPAADAPFHNVVLISIDSVRQDRLGIYGHRPEFAPDVDVTPNIDALAAEGVTFDQAWATTSWTLPSHMAMMTGLTDASHGVVHDYVSLDPLRTTLAEQFARAGYVTAGFFSGPYLDPKYGFGRGFEFYQSGMMPDGERNQWIEARSEELREERRAQGLAPTVTEMDVRQLRDRLSHEDITSPRINEMGLDFLARQADAEEPFFLFLHYFDAHYDYIPEEAEPGLGKKFDPDYQGDFDPNRWYFNPEVRAFGPGNKPVRKISERDLRHALAMYDAEIHWVDRHIGQVVDTLKQTGQWQDTIVAVVSDHGDEFFEHDNIGHRMTLFPEVLLVPWVMRVPGDPEPGQRVPELVRLYDLAPTLLDYALGMGMPDAEGRSVRPLVEDGADRPRTALGQLTMVGQAGGATFRAQTYEVWRDQRYTLQRMMGTPQPFANGSTAQPPFQQARMPNGTPYFFFDRSADAFEQNPIGVEAAAFLPAVDRYRDTYAAHRQHLAELPESPADERVPPTLTAEERQTLVELGYIEEGEVQAPPRLPRFAPYPMPLGPPR